MVDKKVKTTRNKLTKKNYGMIKNGLEFSAKIRVGVLMGGRSIEHEVSFNSGRTVCDHLDVSRYDVIPLFQTQQGRLYLLPWHFLHRGKTTDFIHRLESETTPLSWDFLKEKVDFVYIATHGRYAEDGTLQGMLEVLGIPYLGSGVFTSALRMDKIKQKALFALHNIPTPRFCHVLADQIPNNHEQLLSLLSLLQEKQLSFPLVIKPYNEGSSFGVAVVFNEDELLQAVQHAATVDPRKKKDVLIEEKVEGMEFSCIILSDPQKGTFIPLPPTEIVPIAGTHFFDYEQKYMPGKSIKHTPPRCAPHLVTKIQEVCLRVMHAMDIRTIARIDGFLTADEQVVIIDPNSLSGMDPASFFFRAAAEVGMSHTQIINHLIKAELYARSMLALEDGAENQASLIGETGMQAKKIRVAVLMGGASNEKEISLESGRNITYKLSPQKYEVIPLFVTDQMHLYTINQSLLVRNSTKEISALLLPDMKIEWNDLARIADFVFIGLHGGLGENGSVQGALEMLDLPYNGSSVFASALCMDKYKTTEFLRHHGFDVPKHCLISKSEWECDQRAVLDVVLAKLAFPLIVKPHDDGCSVLVKKIRTTDALIAHISELFAAGKQQALIEEFVFGMELTVGVLGNSNPQALPPTQTVVASDILSIQEKFLPGAGENQTPAPLPHDALVYIKKEIARAYSVVGCKGYARIDCFYQSALESPTGSQRVLILEINTLPALTPATCFFHQAAEVGIKPMECIDMIVQLGLQEHTSCAKQVMDFPVLSKMAQQQEC